MDHSGTSAAAIRRLGNMKWKNVAAAWLVMALFIAEAAWAKSSAKQPLIVVRKPTVIAFFEHVTEKQLEEEPDTNEALSDFQVYVSSVREPLRKRGIEFHEVDAKSFRLRIGSTITTFHGKMDVGYYLIAPGKKPRIEYGVMTDTDLLDLASKYFK